MAHEFKWDTLGITSDQQLRQIAEWMGLPSISYIGFAEDLRKLPEGLSIINLGGHQGGTHWTMLWAEPKMVIYCDSYGVGPEDNIIKLARGRPIIFNTKQVQRYDEAHCGIWVLLSALAIQDGKKRGIEPKKALDSFIGGFLAV